MQVGGHEGVLGLRLVTRPLQVRAYNGIMPSQKEWYEVVTVANTVYLTGMNCGNYPKVSNVAAELGFFNVMSMIRKLQSRLNNVKCE